MLPAKKSHHGRQPRPEENRWSRTEKDLRTNYSLAKRYAKAHNQKPQLKTKEAIEGLMKSARKHLHEINRERAKQYKRPLTIEEIIDLIRESE